MFRTREDVIAEALERQELKFAYVGEGLPVAGDAWDGIL